eukprot:CAMPEP_0198345182 /NCGR_PEP_ID=MMETSP1450-20131203/72421_1 /TAXON_ID=753684 ORGANISM="Madagascaria erythrocladiodes, Strain CCMP3234" /NCGR_SAMPLE_ID=MMETSP1450 /ASSEMBLY_ACC=CAM_ASM_001115 /LENGTH=47 /DNA_ID= /DNA_START= /DNA_END= /DNA_ORIENTATION=
MAEYKGNGTAPESGLDDVPLLLDGSSVDLAGGSPSLHRRQARRYTDA